MEVQPIVLINAVGLTPRLLTLRPASGNWLEQVGRALWRKSYQP